jgi:hypothetical protein
MFFLQLKAHNFLQAVSSRALPCSRQVLKF